MFFPLELNLFLYSYVRTTSSSSTTTTKKLLAMFTLTCIRLSVEFTCFFPTFQTKTFSPFRSTQIRLDTSATSTSDLTTVEKRKFPLHLFPDGRYSRKGFLRTRWRLRRTQVDLVNVHLFHDASNLVSFEAAPSIYCDYRRRALRHVLDHLEADSDGHGRKPFFIFGDFNFRLEGKAVLKKLTRGLSRVEGAGEGTSAVSLGESGKEVSSSDAVKNSADCLQFLDGESEEVVLRVSKKEFRLSRPSLSETFSQRWEQWRRFDRELSAGDAGSRLVEMELNFPPTYPYVEDGDAATGASAYMETRVPAWCDRVLMSYTARDLIVDEDEDEDEDRGLSMGDALQGASSAEYNMIGRDSCMGDHKPVFLRFKLASASVEGGLPSPFGGAADQKPVPTITEMSPTSVRVPRVESPTYTDLLSGGGGGSGTGAAPCTRYVDIKEVSHIKLFKETTV